MGRIFLLKNRSDDPEFDRKDPYEAASDNVTFIPVMKFESTGLDDICNYLETCPAYDGVIVTSQRAVDVLKQAFQQISNCNKFQSLPAYTVGPVTAQRLKLVGFTNVFGADTGNGRALAKEMIPLLEKTNKGPQRFLFAAGEVHRDILPKELTLAGHKIDKLIVYRTESVDYREQLAQVQNGDWIVFFSPSHVDLAIQEIKQRPLVVNIAAIGPTTNQYLLDKGIQVDAVAEHPTGKSLIEAIEKVKK